MEHDYTIKTAHAGGDALKLVLHRCNLNTNGLLGRPRFCNTQEGFLSQLTHTAHFVLRRIAASWLLQLQLGPVLAMCLHRFHGALLDPPHLLCPGHLSFQDVSEAELVSSVSGWAGVGFAHVFPRVQLVILRRCSSGRALVLVSVVMNLSGFLSSLTSASPLRASTFFVMLLSSSCVGGSSMSPSTYFAAASCAAHMSASMIGFCFSQFLTMRRLALIMVWAICFSNGVALLLTNGSGHGAATGFQCK